MLYRLWTVALMFLFVAGCSSEEAAPPLTANANDMRVVLEQAIVDGDIPRIEELLATEPLLLSAASPFSGQPPLHVAVVNNQEAVVRLLLENGADPNVRNDEGSSPAEMAAAAGASEAIVALLQGN